MEPEIDDVSASAFAYTWKHYWYMIVALLFAAIIGTVYVVLLSMQASANGSTVDPQMITFVLLPFFLVFGVYALGAAKVQHEFMKQMAAFFGYAYSASASMDSVSGQTFSEGHSRSIQDVLSGAYRGAPLRIYTFNYTTGSGKSSHTYYKTVFELRLNPQLPDVLLGFPEFFTPSGMTKVTLEGNFNEHFSVYVAQGADVQIREILTPDVMQELIEKYSNLKFEIHAGTLYIDKGSKLTKRQDFIDTQKALDHVVDLFLPGLASAVEDSVAA